jgi:hypothetical protein
METTRSLQKGATKAEDSYLHKEQITQNEQNTDDSSGGVYAPTIPESTVPQESDQESNPFDYGGLPDRNLKKNLGCG